MNHESRCLKISAVTDVRIWMLLPVLLLIALDPALADQSSVVKAENAFFRGSHQLSRDNISEALPALEEAVRLDPSVEKYRRVLAIAYNNQGIKLAKEGKPLEGLRSMETAITIEPKDSGLKGNFVSAVLQAVAGQGDKLKIEDRIYFVQKILEFEPENASAKKAMAAFLNNQGITQAQGGVSPAEIESLNAALAIDPSNQKIRKNLSMVYYNLALQKGKENAFEEQIELLRKSESYSTNDPLIRDGLGRALSNLAVIRGKQGKFDEQIALMKESSEMLPNDALIRKNLAAAYNNQALNAPELKTQERISILENSLKLDQKNQTTLSNLSTLLTKLAVDDFKAGSAAKAVSLLEKAIKMDPANKSAQSNLAAIYHNEALRKGEEGKSDEEIQLLNKALSLSGNNKTIKSDLAAAYNDQAVNYGKKGDHKQELQVLLKASKLDSENQVIKDNLAKARQRDTGKEKKSDTGSSSKKKQDG